jgi:hypothetical protein
MGKNIVVDEQDISGALAVLHTEIIRLTAENSLLSGTLDSRDRNIEMLVEENKRMTAERDALRIFAQFVMEAWPDDDIDGGDLQDKAVELGLLKLEDPAPTDSCGEYCRCAEMYSCEEWENGEVMCYRRTALLTGETK